MLYQYDVRYYSYNNAIEAGLNYSSSNVCESYITQSIPMHRLYTVSHRFGWAGIAAKSKVAAHTLLFDSSDNNQQQLDRKDVELTVDTNRYGPIVLHCRTVECVVVIPKLAFL